MGPVRYGLNDEVSSLFSRHYFETILPETAGYRAFDASDQIAQIESIIEADVFRNEADVEEKVIRRIFRELNLAYEVQTGMAGQSIDYAIYSGASFNTDYSNTILLVEAEPYGKLAKRYLIKKQDNSDPIAQIRNYLRQSNERLANTETGKLINYGLLTDGAKWRVYARKFTHDDKQFEQNFIEFDMVQLRALPDENQLHYLKLFCYLLSEEGIKQNLEQTVQESSTHEEAVTTELRKQVYTALELIATGIWRRIMTDEDAGLRAVLEARYGLNEADLDDPGRRPELLKIVYDESLVFLLRLLFILFIEDRQFAGIAAIKQPGGVLDAIKAQDKPIGQLTEAHHELGRNFDIDIVRICKEIDQRYNGGIFSDKLHPLLAGFNIDDTLFANAIDNLCRVRLRSRIVTVDFGSMSIRELGTIYEGLLEYKLMVADEAMGELTTLADKKKKRLNVRAGDLYLINQNGERKSTGSYYTPDDIVRYLVSQTVGARIETQLASLTDPTEQLEQLSTITICDPAMGSGHFLVEAFDELVSSAEHIIEANELDEHIEDVRARLARQCIYGADINPIAVDIAKMVMWLRIFHPDKPLEFFDANFVCGDSLIGSYDEVPELVAGQSASLFMAPEEYEPEMLGVLADRTRKMLAMSRSTIADIKAVEAFYRDEILTYQKNITFLAHLRLVKHLLPEQAAFVAGYYEDVARKLMGQHDYVAKLYMRRNDLNKKQSQLFDIVEHIERQFNPLHWQAQFPHIFVNGGFDVVLGNPPWDVVKGNHNTFFSDYVDGYDQLETKQAKSQSNKLMERQPRIRQAYEAYLANVTTRNSFFQGAYEYQVVKDSQGAKLKGDPNLYKIFIEKAYTILKTGGSCGLVVPSGLNTDQGATGLRRLLFQQATVKELIMFENRRSLFPAVDSRYKFDALIYGKVRSKQPKFTSGFYWLDPRWLVGEPSGLDPESRVLERAIHERYEYPLKLSDLYSPEMEALIEARSLKDVPILEIIAKQPLFGDRNQSWHAETYNEFHMTSDANLFNTDDIGYPLLEGKTIHQFEAAYATPTRHVISEQGESRLASKWRCKPHELPHRGYRLAWRDIARSNDTRTVIATVLPPYSFTGNTLNMIGLAGLDPTPQHLAGVASVLNSFVLDYVIRFRISTHVNMFYLKELPLIRDQSVIADLGERALPLFTGRDFRDFRDGAAELTDPAGRLELRAELDARVAKAYNLTYEQLQHILMRFPLVDENIKTETLRAYRGP